MADDGNIPADDDNEPDASGDKTARDRMPDDRTARRQEAVALLLAGGSSVRAAARRTRVGERTIHRWLREDRAFCDLIFTTRNRLFERALARLSRLGGKAARVLGKLLDDADPRIRLGAAKAILDSGKTLSEFFGLVKRVEALEAGQRAWDQGLVGAESKDTSEATGDALC